MFRKKDTQVRKNYKGAKAAKTEKEKQKQAEQISRAHLQRLQQRRNSSDNSSKTKTEEKKEGFASLEKEAGSFVVPEKEKTEAVSSEQKGRSGGKTSADRQDMIKRRIEEYYAEQKIREQNRQKKAAARKRGDTMRKGGRAVAVALVLILAVLISRKILSGINDKEEEAKKVVELNPISDRKDYAEYIAGINEEQLLWDTLLKHFEGNETATLGVMCNLKSESRFKAGNLEDYNNRLWQIDDEEYTRQVNEKITTRKDFLEARHLGDTNGYYNKYDEWVNLDGGYGYAQYTSYEKKEGLYRFAEKWFEKGGQGEGWQFDIANPEMQATYVVYLLDSTEYSRLDKQLRRAANVVDVCYLWLKDYEIPYDPYNDDYYTMAFERAEAAKGIKERCAKEKDPLDDL